MSNVVCPKCRVQLHIDDVNIEEGAALCRSCKMMHRLRDCLEVTGMVEAASADVPKGCRVVSDGGPTIIEASIASGWKFAATLFVCLFWNGVVSVFLFHVLTSLYVHLIGPLPAWLPFKQATQQPAPFSIGLLVFLIPFVVIGVGMMCAVVLRLVGVVRVKLDEMKGSTFIGVGAIGWTRRFDISSVTSVREGISNWKGQNNAPIPVIELGGVDMRFGTLLNAEQRRWMMGMLSVLMHGERKGVAKVAAKKSSR